MERGKRDKMLYLILILGAVACFAVASKKGVFGSKLTPELESLIISKAKEWKLSPALVKAHAKVESNFNPAAKNPSDPSYGLLQITPRLAYDYGLITHYRNLTQHEIDRIMDPKNNLNVACWFIRKLRIKYSFDVTIQMYNVGEAGYNKGVRNLTYLEKVKGYYHEYS